MLICVAILIVLMLTSSPSIGCLVKRWLDVYHGRQSCNDSHESGPSARSDDDDEEPEIESGEQVKK